MQEFVCRRCRAGHIVVQCEKLNDLRQEIYEHIGRVGNGVGRHILEDTDNMLYMLM